MNEAVIKQKDFVLELYREYLNIIVKEKTNAQHINNQTIVAALLTIAHLATTD